jgi:hypothetical protein
LLTERRKHFNLKPFPYDIHVFVTNDIAQCHDRWGKRANVFTEEEMKSIMALTVTDPSWSDCYIFLEEGCSLEEIAHEVTHAVIYFLTYVGAAQDSEFMAYYIGWLTDRISNFVRTKRKPAKQKAT